jgi:hypothetical protein
MKEWIILKEDYLFEIETYTLDKVIDRIKYLADKGIKNLNLGNIYEYMLQK